MSIEELIDFLKDKGKNRFDNPEEIAKIMKSIPQTLTSVKGIGDVFSAGIIAETGEIIRFKNHNALAKYTGLIWNKYQSGDFEAEDTKGCIPAINTFVIT